MKTYKQLIEGLPSYAMRNNTAGSLKSKPEEIDHHAEIAKITHAMTKFPSGDAKIEASQKERIAYHSSQLNKNNK